MNIYIVLYREIDGDDSENISIATYADFNQMRADGRVYAANTESLVFSTDNQQFFKLDNLENIEFETTSTLLTTLLNDPVTFDSVLSDEYTNLENTITILETENKLLKEQLAKYQKG